MIPHTKHLLLLVIFISFLACKQQNNFSIEEQVSYGKSINEAASLSAWQYSAIYPIDSVDTSQIDAIRNFYKDVVFELEERTIKVIGIGSEEIYSNKVAIDTYFKHAYLKNYYEKLFSEHYKKPMPDSVISIRNKNAYQSNSVLKPYFNDAFMANDFLLIEQDGFTILFKPLLGFEKTKPTKLDGIDTIDFFDKGLIGLSIKDIGEKEVYKKYWIDDVSVCLCNSPSLFFDTESHSLVIYNYCDKGIPKDNMDKAQAYTIASIENNRNAIEVRAYSKKSQSQIVINCKQVNDFPVYEIIFEGSFPNEYVGKRLTNFFTTQPEKFDKADCGDFGG